MIQAVGNYNISASPNFKKTQPKQAATDNSKDYKIPIKSGFEYVDAVKAAFAGGALLAVRFLGEAEIWADGPSEIISRLIAKKGVRGAITTGAIGFFGIALLCTLGVMPKYLYKKKQEIFVKKNEANVFVRKNAAEQELYERIRDEAKAADTAEKRAVATRHLATMEMSGTNKFPVKF